MGQLSNDEIRIYRDCVSELIQDKGLQSSYRDFQRFLRRQRLRRFGWQLVQALALGGLALAMLMPGGAMFFGHFPRRLA